MCKRRVARQHAIGRGVAETDGGRCDEPAADRDRDEGGHNGEELRGIRLVRGEDESADLGEGEGAGEAG